MSAEREYKINIKTVNDGAGAEEAASDLKKVAGAANETGEGLGKASRELRHILTQAGGGEIAELLRAATLPMIIGEGAVLAYKEVAKALEQIHDQQLKVIEDARQWAEVQLKAASSAMETAADRAASWRREMEHLHDSIDQVAISEKNALELSKLKTQELTAQNSLAASFAEMQVNTMEAAGALTKEQAEIRILAIKLQQKKIDDELADKIKRDEQGSKMYEAHVAGGKAAEAAASIPGLEAGRTTQQNLLNLGEGTLDRLTREKAAADKAADEARTKIKTSTLYNEGGNNWTDADIANFVKQYQTGKLPGNMPTGFKDLIAQISQAEFADSAVRTQEHKNKGYQRELDDMDANIKAAQALTKSQTLLSEKLNEEADQIGATRSATKAANTQANAQQEEMNREIVATKAFPDAGWQAPGNLPGLSPAANLERDIAQTVAGLGVYASGGHNEAFLKTVLDALKQLVSSHQLTAGQIADATAEINNIWGTISARGPH